MSFARTLKTAALLGMVWLCFGVAGAAAKEAAPDATVKTGTPEAGQRLVKTGTIKMQCPAGHGQILRRQQMWVLDAE